MDRKFMQNLERAFGRRGGRISSARETPPELTRAFLEALIDCPDCRGAILEACNATGRSRENVDIDALMRGLGLSHGH